MHLASLLKNRNQQNQNHKIKKYFTEAAMLDHETHLLTYTEQARGPGHRAVYGAAFFQGWHRNHFSVVRHPNRDPAYKSGSIPITIKILDHCAQPYPNHYPNYKSLNK